MSNTISFEAMSLNDLRDDLEKKKAILEKAAVEQGITPENLEEKLHIEQQTLTKKLAELQKKAFDAAIEGNVGNAEESLREMQSLMENNWALAYSKYNKGVSVLKEKASAILLLLSTVPTLTSDLNEKYKKFREISLAGQNANGVNEENLQEKFQEELNRLGKSGKELLGKFDEAVKAGNNQDALKYAKELNDQNENSWAIALTQITKIRKVNEAIQTIIEYFGDTSK